jgi:hypothetical protein
MSEEEIEALVREVGDKVDEEEVKMGNTFNWAYLIQLAVLAWLAFLVLIFFMGGGPTNPGRSPTKDP